MRPVPTLYEKNFTIVKPFPISARKSLALIDYNNSNDLIKAIISLDNLYNEKPRNNDFEKHSSNYNNSNYNQNYSAKYNENKSMYNGQENVNINQFKIQNKNHSSSYRGRANFSKHRGRDRQFSASNNFQLNQNSHPNNFHLNQNTYPYNYQLNQNPLVNEQPQIAHNTPSIIPDTRFPPPIISSNSTHLNQNSQNQQNHLNGK